MKEFFKKMFSGADDVSSKRVLGTFLIVVVYTTAAIIATIKGAIAEEVVDLVKAGLYTGAALLGLGVADRLATLLKK